MKSRILILIFALVLVAAGIAALQAQAPPAAPAAPAAGQRGGAPGSENGLAVFQTQCTACHGNPNVDRAPSPTAIREMSPERIYNALTTGLMKDQGEKLSDADRRGVAEFMSGRPLGSSQLGDAKNMPNQCRNNPALSDPARGASWNPGSAHASKELRRGVDERP